MTDSWPHEASPFHKGEQEVQRRIGVADRAEKLARRVVRDHMPDEHREFYENLPFLILGSVDTQGRPWASLIAGEPGFMRSPDPTHLSIKASPLPGDPLTETLRPDLSLGVLGIEPSTRRRNRMTGNARNISKDGFDIEVSQAYGNCPKFIQTRTINFKSTKQAELSADVEKSTSFSEQAKQVIAKADTFFIASTYSDESNSLANGSDVSHRGGNPGFVKVENDHSLLFPDFAGNKHFNTFGNLLLNPKAGLLFIDFDTGDLFYLTGSAEIIWEGPELDSFDGAERLVRFDLEECIQSRNALPLKTSFGEYSPFLNKTGVWA